MRFNLDDFIGFSIASIFLSIGIAITCAGIALLFEGC